ncbi:MAG TPA: C1 family peptidase [Flavobacteriales bacterium]|nr:C1 family peptidase [Flavobacteriales bacterium]
MPIRMTPDQPDGPQRNRPSFPRGSGGRSGGGGIGGGLIGSLLPMLFRNPKLLLMGAVILGILWFMGGLDGCGGMLQQGGQSNLLSMLTTGANLDPAEYDKAEVHEPLADNVNNPLPERYSLDKFAPPRLNQGQQGSCVAWASAYAARSIIHNQATGAAPSKASAFSPSFMYNRIKIENSNCQGSYLHRAMDDMLVRGAVPFSEFAYSDQTCNNAPDPSIERNASRYRIKGFQRLSRSDDPNSPVDLLAMKQQLAQGSPVVIGMMVGGSFMQGMEGQEIWYPTANDQQMRGFGGHAMCVIGYDDFKLGTEGGAFQIMNSWGPEWGSNGIAWVPYDAFAYFTKEAYAVYPMGESADVKTDRYDLRFGLAVVDAAGQPTGEYIALVSTGGRSFRTATPVRKGTRFKVEVTNNLECYTYIFGQEADASTYVLFPYTPKHSPYCGTTGMRQFPRDHSLTADEQGTKDVMAILVANQPMDYPAINKRMNEAKSGGLAEALAAVMGQELLPETEAQYTAGETFGVKAPAARNALALVIEVEKR